MAAKPLITACVCTYDRYDVLPGALESLLNQTLDRSRYRILVIDNSPDCAKSEEFGKAWHNPPFLDYLVEKRPGLSNARNVGARTCRTEFIAYMDDDASASPQWLEKVLEGFEQFGKQAAVLGGKVDPIWEVPRPVWLHDWLLGFVSVVNWGGSVRVAAPNEWFAGTNIVFRTSVLMHLGGFDVNLGRIGSGTTLLSNEEIGLLHAIREQGNLAIYAPEASVSHLVEKERLTRQWFRKRAGWQAVSDFMMDPKATTQRAQKGWGKLTDYFFSLPPRERTVRGLHFNTNDPELFRKQLEVIQFNVIGVLSGFETALPPSISTSLKRS